MTSILHFFVHFLNLYSILNIFKKRWFSELMYFWIYGLEKTSLDKCLIGPVSEHPSTSHMVNGPKHCWNLNDSTFTIFIDHCECNSGPKSLSEWYAKSEDCLLTHWLPKASIIFLTEAIHCDMFRCNYLRNEKLSPNFFFAFSSFIFIFKIFKQRWTS